MVMDALYGSNYNNGALVSSAGRNGTGASEWTHGSWKVGRRDFDDFRPSSRSRPKSEMSFRSQGEVGLHKNLDELSSSPPSPALTVALAFIVTLYFVSDRELYAGALKQGTSTISCQ